jgi:hypothetical protein
VVAQTGREDGRERTAGEERTREEETTVARAPGGTSVAQV